MLFKNYHLKYLVFFCTNVFLPDSEFHYDYEQTHGVDLYKSAIKSYNKEIAKMMNLDGRIRRMDSMMINSNMRMLARSELIYTSIARLVQYLAVIPLASVGVLKLRRN